MLKGFKNFLMRGDVIVAAVGLVIALAFSTLVKAFTDFVINPLVAAAQGGNTIGLGWQLNSDCTGQACQATFLNIGEFISAIIYFIIFMAVVYFVLVLPYKHVQARRGITVFGDEPPTKVCPECLSDDIPDAARKCKHCGSEQPQTGGAHSAGV
ncbi:MscL family protein [Speluncibacter jeojiensis]|uniref:MscL family protein n=1 Tax=Speluncibacter jeojiensis TaxID=2710754 RepID=A0A9X4LYA9_9ACTN|nr:MscL family protein [Corynebacteriales bacterium D3-21]